MDFMNTTTNSSELFIIKKEEIIVDESTSSLDDAIPLNCQNTDLCNFEIDSIFSIVDEKENIQELFPHLPLSQEREQDLIPYVSYPSPWHPQKKVLDDPKILINVPSTPLGPVDEPYILTGKKETSNNSLCKQWVCNICNKEFRYLYTLQRHLPIHTDVRNFKCNICYKSFRQFSTLTQHKVIHSNERPYICGSCGKTFNRISTLISHRKTHSSERPHKCRFCGKGFNQKGNLRNHEFTHTDERPYKCQHCGKGFNQMSNLMCHKFHAHSEEVRYMCRLCDLSFQRRISLREHEQTNHGIQYSAASESSRENMGKKNSSFKAPSHPIIQQSMDNCIIYTNK